MNLRKIERKIKYWRFSVNTFILIDLLSIAGLFLYLDLTLTKKQRNEIYTDYGLTAGISFLVMSVGLLITTILLSNKIQKRNNNT